MSELEALQLLREAAARRDTVNVCTTSYTALLQWHEIRGGWTLPLRTFERQLSMLRKSGAVTVRHVRRAGKHTGTWIVLAGEEAVGERDQWVEYEGELLF